MSAVLASFILLGARVTGGRLGGLLGSNVEEVSETEISKYLNNN
jgi:hypothetical protein